ncbi:MAG TPA: FmdB family zinc ribbon protein [Albitalea sp.]|nr:FmdB family zinc ribbon protein [Albitalea sp.]
MPIYAYRCESCGHAKDVLQKVSDPVLSTCPACHAESFKKQLTAAGFQLKGSGWYVTDFRGGNSNGAAKANGSAATNGDAKPDAGKAESAKSEPAAAASTSAAGSSGDGAASGGCGSSCACH